ncbi:MAG: NAD-dependent dehydratase, partial [Clostridia bacterium]|nr:NAD-dependent dehydratase [Clostridia bacterium]
NQIYAIIADELGVELKAYHVPSDFLDEVGKYDYRGGLIGDKSNTVVFDNSKVKRAVPGFTCTVRADQGLRKTVQHMLATPELQQDDPEFDQWCDKVIAALDAAKEAIKHG